MWKLTQEQKEIVEHQGDAKINAVAGSGKTTTLLQYAMARPKYSSILYLAFNQSVKKEAERKFSQLGLGNVRIETAHSLAFSQVVRGSKFTLKKEGTYKLHEIKDILKLKKLGREANSEYILANHIQKFAQYFCNQTASKVQEVNYLEVVEAGEARDFVEKHYEKIELGVRELLAKMNRGEIELTHEFYLKKFQLLRPNLQHDYILFDEGQDASPVMLDVFLAQENAQKIIVGDTHQQIYGWRYAINALQQVDFQNFHLSTSFRFNPNIALLANHYLSWKEHFGQQPDSVALKGVGKNKKIESRATLARTNLFLLKKAIDWITKNHLESLYFEGNINSYTYAGEGASIWDVLHLHNGRTNLVRDTLLKTMDSLDELKEYCTKSDDVEMSMLMEIVNEYKNDLPNLLNRLKEKHVADNEKHKAQMIFSTIHRCKGMEYDEVFLEPDFIHEAEIFKQIKEGNLDSRQIQKTMEEINLLYVAVTRTRNRLNLPEVYFPKFDNINLIYQAEKTDEKSFKQNIKQTQNKEVSKPSASISRTQRDKSWSKTEDARLKVLVKSGLSVAKIALHLQKKEDAIHARINKLGLR